MAGTSTAGKKLTQVERAPLPDDPGIVVSLLADLSAFSHCTNHARITPTNAGAFFVSLEKVPLPPAVLVPDGASHKKPAKTSSSTSVSAASAGASYPAALALPPPPSSSVFSFGSLSFDPRVADLFDNEDLRSSLPCDVELICAAESEAGRDAKGATVMAHKFVLVFSSEFFKVRFGGGRWANKASQDDNNNSIHATVDLSGSEHATFPLVSTVVRMLYKGCASMTTVTIPDLISMLYLADFLIVPAVSKFCESLLCALMDRASPDFVMTLCRIAEQLRADRLRDSVAKKLKTLPVEPAGFYEVPLPVMLDFLEKPESYAFSNMSPVCGLEMVEREKYLFDLAILFLNNVGESRIKHAPEIFKRIKLTYVVDFFELGEYFELYSLYEMDEGMHIPVGDSALVKLEEAAIKCRRLPNFYTSGIPKELWAPRPGSVKYSFWTIKRFGHIRYRCNKTSSKAEKALMKSYKPRMINFQRPSGIRIVGVDVSSRKIGEEEVIDGIALHWSDETSDYCGGIEESDWSDFSLTPDPSPPVAGGAQGGGDVPGAGGGVPGAAGGAGAPAAGGDAIVRRHHMYLGEHDGVQPRLQSGDFIKGMVFVSSRNNYTEDSKPSSEAVLGSDGRVRWGPMGRPNLYLPPSMEAKRSDPEMVSLHLDSAISPSCKSFADRCFLDGLKGVCIRVGPEARPVLTSVRFKMSVLADGPLEHLHALPDGHGQPVLNEDFLETCFREMPMAKLGRAMKTLSKM